MKIIFRFGVLLCMALTLAACGTGDGEEDGDIQLVESEPLEAADSVATEEVNSRAVEAADEDLLAETNEAETDIDPYVGEYCDYDTGEPNLEIQKNEDETYQLYIGIFRLASFDDGAGMLTEKGLEFTATAPDGSETGGVITLDQDVAIVTFEPGWSGFETVNSFSYYKTSDTPDMELLSN